MPFTTVYCKCGAETTIGFTNMTQIRRALTAFWAIHNGNEHGQTTEAIATYHRTHPNAATYAIKETPPCT